MNKFKFVGLLALVGVILYVGLGMGQELKISPLAKGVGRSMTLQEDTLWYFKACYDSNYAPAGMPDFDQKQDNWTNPTSGKWSFCGPTALANCLWWLDSRFEHWLARVNGGPLGLPGDQYDRFPLVRDYTDNLAQAYIPPNPPPGTNNDDHAADNVDNPNTTPWSLWPPGAPPGPYNPFAPGLQPIPQYPQWGELIERLAWCCNCDGAQQGGGWEGTYVHDMENCIDNWLMAEGLDTLLYEHTVDCSCYYDLPWFIDEQIHKSQDVILLLGFWYNEGEVWYREGGHYVTVAGVGTDPLGGTILAISDPYYDNAEPAPQGNGGPGCVHNSIYQAHPTPHPASLHNDAGNASHDWYALAPTAPPHWAYHWMLVGYPGQYKWDNFFGQNVPKGLEKYQDVKREHKNKQGFFTLIEYAVVVSPYPDHGDAPAPYPDAHHSDWTEEWLGAKVSGDMAPRLVNLDTYDDGVTFLTPLCPGEEGSLKVTISVRDRFACEAHGGRYDGQHQLYLHGWIDWSGDGNWDDPGENIFCGVPFDPSTWASNSNIYITTFTVPTDAQIGDTWARFRLDYNQSLNDPAGQAYCGEVEDYPVEIMEKQSSVVINEFIAKGTEWIELYNYGACPVTMTGWYVQDDGGTDNSISGVTIPAGGYYSWNTTLNLGTSGDYIELYDGSKALIDRVAYGNKGGCPLPPYGSNISACRAPNGSDTDDDARDWTLDRSSTRDAANDAPAPQLGSSLILNEIDPYPSADGDSLELYNPTGSAVDITNWWFSDGDDIIDLPSGGTVPAGGWLVLAEGSGDWPDGQCDFSSGDVAYLFNASGVRVDQLGWYGEYNDHSFQRCPDGNGPNDGYDWTSSGGDTSLFDTTATWGAANCVYCEPPQPPSNLICEATDTCIVLNWTNTSEYDSVAVYRSWGGVSEMLLVILPGGSESYHDATCCCSGNYDYHVTGFHCDEESGPSDTCWVYKLGEVQYSWDFNESDQGWMHYPDPPGVDSWQWGMPTYGPEPGMPTCPDTGGTPVPLTNCWATISQGPYSPFSCCRLFSPPVQLDSCGALLEICHWYAMTPEPPDGGNVKVSTDDGVTWELITPCQGYPCPFLDTECDKIVGLPGYSGMSPGWVLDYFDLAALGYGDSTVQIAFDFGSNDNPDAWPGWYIKWAKIYHCPVVGGAFIRGDYDENGQLLTNDPLMELQFIFGVPGATPPSCEDAADYDDDGKILTNDPLMALQFIFGVPGSVPPPPPYGPFPGGCGPDPTDDDLTCADHACQHLKATPSYKPSVSVSNAPNKLLLEEAEFINGKVRVPFDLTINEPVCGFDISVTYNTSSLRFEKVVGGDGYDFWAVDTRQAGVVRIGGVPDIEMAKLLEPGTYRVGEMMFEVKEMGNMGLRWKKAEVYGAQVQPLSVEWVVKTGESILPTQFALEQNYPNPFNLQTAIRYQLPEDCRVTLEIYNLLGEKVKTLISGEQKANYYTAYWDGKDAEGKEISSGIYFYKLQAGSFTQTRKLVILK